MFAIFFKNNLNYNIINVYLDIEGHQIILKVQGSIYTIINVSVQIISKDKV